MDILSINDAPALFISKEGATKTGLKVIAKLPTKIKGFKVSELIHVRGDAGYHLTLFPTDRTEKPRKLTNKALDLLL